MKAVGWSSSFLHIGTLYASRQGQQHGFSAPSAQLLHCCYRSVVVVVVYVGGGCSLSTPYRALEGAEAKLTVEGGRTY